MGAEIYRSISLYKEGGTSGNSLRTSSWNTSRVRIQHEAVGGPLGVL